MGDDQQNSTPTEYEETPVIDDQTGHVSQPETTPDIVKKESPPIGPEHEIAAPSNDFVPHGVTTQKKQSGLLGSLGNFVLFAVLFAFGVGASVFLRQYLAQSHQENAITTKPQVTVTPTPIPTVSTDPYAKWNSYQVISSNTKQPIVGLSFKLPPEVLAPICDGPSCASQGTYLPGGTRLTVAPRGKGQALPSTIGAIMTDAGGREFVMKEASVSGMPSQEFSGLFAGTTGGGYTFAQIRGVVVHGPEGISLEINHFAPTGVNANWDTDDLLFDKMLETVVFERTIFPTQVATPTATPTTNLQPTP